MLARVFSCAVIGLDGVIVEVEVDTSQGLPGMTIVGLPDTARCLFTVYWNAAPFVTPPSPEISVESAYTTAKRATALLVPPSILVRATE